MNCYICDDRDRATAAVAICNHCGIGLCRDHLDEDLLGRRVHGMVRRGCTHLLLHSASSRGVRQALHDPVPDGGPS